MEINIATSFFGRHKILNCISEFLGVGSVDGVIEADEVFFAYSYKGTKPTNVPRPSRHRGKEIKKRGISKEQVCVATKYLSNYLKWHKWINIFITEKETIRIESLIVHINISHSYTMIKEFKNRQRIFV